MAVALVLVAVVPPPELLAAVVPPPELLAAVAPPPELLAAGVPPAVVPPPEPLLLLHAAAMSTAANGSATRIALIGTEWVTVSSPVSAQPQGSQGLAALSNTARRALWFESCR